jgi:hypothetical protein
VKFATATRGAAVKAAVDNAALAVIAAAAAAAAAIATALEIAASLI